MDDRQKLLPDADQSLTLAPCRQPCQGGCEGALTSEPVSDCEHPNTCDLRPTKGAAGFAARVSCHWSRPLQPGHCVQLRAEIAGCRAEVWALVLGCQAEEESYRIELGISDREQAFKARMLAQICEILRFQAEVRRRQGSNMDANEAAGEWIREHACHF